MSDRPAPLAIIQNKHNRFHVAVHISVYVYIHVYVYVYVYIHVYVHTQSTQSFQFHGIDSMLLHTIFSMSVYCPGSDGGVTGYPPQPTLTARMWREIKSHKKFQVERCGVGEV